MFRILYNLTCTVRIRKDLRFHSLQRCSTKARSNVENNIEDKWVCEKENEILQVVNESNMKELSKYIQSSYAEAIMSNRTNNGPYKSLNDLLSQTKLTSDDLNDFYTLVITHKMKKRKWKQFVVTPDIKTIVMPKTVLGIHVGPNAVTWTLLSCDLKILDWDCLGWHDKTVKDIDTFNLINLASSIAQTLPLSSSYVMEDLKTTSKSLQKMLSVQQQLNIAIMSCLKLMENQGKNNSMEPKNSIYVLQNMTSARFFNLVIGNEIIASKYIMKLILNNEALDKELQLVHVDDELKRKFTTRNLEQQEQIGWSLAKALTFIRLVTIFNVNLRYRESD